MSVPKFGRVEIPPIVGMTGVENTIQNILFGTKEGGKVASKILHSEEQRQQVSF